MNIKEELIKLKESISNKPNEPLLTRLVNEYLNWYLITICDGNKDKCNDMKNFIEKVAVWYELKYPDYDINNIINHNAEYSDNSYSFKHNYYENKDSNNLYDINRFLKSLPSKEKSYFIKPEFKNTIYLDENTLLIIDHNAYIKKSLNITYYTDYMVNDNEIININLKTLLRLFKERNIYVKNSQEILKIINDIDNWNNQKVGMLNSIMYRIIERGGKKIGPRRAFLFAKEFNSNIDIPMIYGIDESDLFLNSFVNEYLDNGGLLNLECYVNYFANQYNNRIDTITINELIKEDYKVKKK